MAENPLRISVQQPKDSFKNMARSPPADGVIVNRESETKPKSSMDTQRAITGLPSKLMRSLSQSAGPNAHSNGPEGRKGSTAGMDPLSKHIIERKGGPNANSGKALPSAPSQFEESVEDEDSGSPNTPRPSFEPSFPRTETVISTNNVKKNRVSFLSRFRPKRKETEEMPDPDEDPQDIRAEGANAEAFAMPIGYIPKYPEPPKYIKMRGKAKKDRDFDHVFLAQELRGRTGVEVAQAGGRKINPAAKVKYGDAIWAMDFSRDGKYLAAAGHDHIVRLWAVIGTPEEREAHERQEELDQTRLSAPVFRTTPIQEYEGHESTVLDLSWSKNNFLLSSSMDKTVRLWHTSRGECLCAFKHTDYVTAIQFHPTDDRFFLAGALDSKLRLWSIPDKTVAFASQINDVVTAVSFTPDGKTAIAGCLSGICMFFETEGLRQQTQMHVKSAHGKNSKGSKITGIQAINWPPSDPKGDIKLLVTSNDSRVRVYNLRDKCLELKLKGAENNSSQIRATFSDDAKYIISGSEDKKVYIWSTGPAEKDKDKRPVEMFEAGASVVTQALMAPTRTRQLLQASGDPLFDICNPPPVQLISRAESRASNHPDHHSEDGRSVNSELHKNSQKPEESPAWVTRSGHPNGNIIVTADFNGHIKVFRQDCAYQKRLKNSESWDTQSNFSKRVLHRSSSVATRGSRRSGRDSITNPSDRILSWRQSVDRSQPNSPALSATFDVAGSGTNHRSSGVFGRSHSPRKSMTSSLRNSIGAGGINLLSGAGTPPARNSPTFPQRPRPSLAQQQRTPGGAADHSGNVSVSSSPTRANGSQRRHKATSISTPLQHHQSADAPAISIERDDNDDDEGDYSAASDREAPRRRSRSKRRRSPGLLQQDPQNPLHVDRDDNSSAAFYSREHHASLANALVRERTVDIDGRSIEDRSSGVVSEDDSAVAVAGSSRSPAPHAAPPPKALVDSTGHLTTGEPGTATPASSTNGTVPFPAADLPPPSHSPSPSPAPSKSPAPAPAPASGGVMGGGLAVVASLLGGGRRARAATADTMATGTSYGTADEGRGASRVNLPRAGSESSEEEEGPEEEEERCSRCGGMSFRMRKGKRGGGRVLECVKCGLAVE